MQESAEIFGGFSTAAALEIIWDKTQLPSPINPFILEQHVGAFFILVYNQFGVQGVVNYKLIVQIQWQKLAQWRNGVEKNDRLLVKRVNHDNS